MTRLMLPQLPRRLEGVLGLVRPCEVLADVGTDHGWLPVAAVRRGVARRAIAVDRCAAPLAGARAHVQRLGVGDRVQTWLGEGLCGLESRGIDVVVIAGMSAGGALDILDAAPRVLADVRQLIIQPNQGAQALRAWALHSGWHLRDEQMIEERGQVFVVCAFAPGQGDDPAYALPGWTREALCGIGPHLLARRDAVARRWFERQQARVSRWVERDVERLRPELEVLDAACRLLRSEQGGFGS